MEYIGEQIELVSKIVKGEINKAGVEKELSRMEQQYGSECFNSYPVKRKPKPWTKEHLNELEVLSSSGASSKEFYLYMAEVSEEVYKFKLNKKIIIAIIVVIAIVLGFLIISSSSKKSKNEVSSISKSGCIEQIIGGLYEEG